MCVCVCVCVCMNHLKLMQPYKLTILQLKKKLLRMTKDPSNGCQDKSLAIIIYTITYNYQAKSLAIITYDYL